MRADRRLANHAAATSRGAVVDAEDQRELQRVGVPGERLVQDAVLADPFEIDALGQ